MDANSDSRDCTSHCRSTKCATNLISVITRGSTRQIKTYFERCCNNASHVSDQHGRTALHMAASCGKWEIVEWLMKEKNADWRSKDKESGWTALHRSLFYGQVMSAVYLIYHGASLQKHDHEDLTPLELVMKDLPAYVDFDPRNPTQAYAWGSNTNFTLGHGNQQSKGQPELLEELAKSNISVKQIAMCKFHTVILSHGGSVYTCGHGQGGRLGLGDEETSLVPRCVEGLPTEAVCVQVAVARDHTVFLMENGTIYSCGQNDYHQLGHSSLGAKCLTPKPLYNKILRNKNIVGIAVGRFHTVVYTSEAVYTFGLNAGQLGHIKGEKHVISPRQVTALQHKNVVICQVAASDAATVVATKAGDIYVLNEYQSRKVASKQINLTKVVVNGGTLDAELDQNTLQKRGGEELVMITLQKSGKIHSWRETDRVLRLCQWTRKRQIFISDIAVNRLGLLLATEEGEGYMGYFTKRKEEHKRDATSPTQAPTASSPPPSHGTSTSEDAFIFAGPVEKEEYDTVHLERLSSLFRVTGVACDQQGKNFAALQSDPRTSLTDIPVVSGPEIEKHFTNLLKEADETDVIHDVIIKIGNRSVAAHKYILSHRSEYFQKLFAPPQPDTNESDAVSLQLNNEGAVTVDITDKTNEYEIFMMALRYMYTDNCEIFTRGFKYRPSSGSVLREENSDTTLHQGFNSLRITDTNRGRSAYSVYKDEKAAKNTGKGHGGKRKKKTIEKTEREDAMLPVKMLIEVSKKLGIKMLVKRLDQVKYKDGHLQNFRPSGKKLRFERRRAPHLCDVVLQSEDGQLFPCHKCVLVARLEYFQSMLGSGWIETSSTDPLKLPIPGRILDIILDFMYTDSAPSIKESQDIELLCHALTTADQLLMTRLKEMCEGALADLITLKNVAELLQFASVYQAKQLRNTCHQYINLNLACLLEAKALEILDKDVLQELSNAYRDRLPVMSYRMVTPYHGGPDITDIESEDVSGEDESNHMDDAQATDNPSQKTDVLPPSNLDQIIKKARAKRKGRRRMSSSGKRNSVSVSEDSVVPVVESKEDGMDVDATTTAPTSTVVTKDVKSDDAATKMVDGDGVSPVAMETYVFAGGDARVGESIHSLNADVVQKVTHPAGTWIKKGHPDQLDPGQIDPKKGQSGQVDPKKGLPGQVDLKKGHPGHLDLRGQSINTVSSKPADQAHQNSSPKTWASWQSPKASPVPTVDPSPSDLRNIMEAQAKVTSQRKTHQASAKSPTGKKSQKQRRREMALQLSGGSGGMVAEKSTGSDGDGKPLEQSQPSCPWGSLSQPSPSATSLKSLQEEEERAVGNRQTGMSTRSKSIAVPQRAPVHFSYGVKSPPNRRVSEGENRSEAASPVSPTGEYHNPWQHQVQPTVAKSPPMYTAPSVSFTDILKAETEKRENLNKSLRKPFSTIQIEERAIEELKLMYKVGDCPGEYITIERVGVVVAAPTWKKEKKNDV